MIDEPAAFIILVPFAIEVRREFQTSGSSRIAWLSDISYEKPACFDQRGFLHVPVIAFGTQSGCGNQPTASRNLRRAARRPKSCQQHKQRTSAPPRNVGERLVKQSKSRVQFPAYTVALPTGRNLLPEPLNRTTEGLALLPLEMRAKARCWKPQRTPHDTPSVSTNQFTLR